MHLDFFVPGKPIPQGSMRTYNGRIVHSAGPALRAWRKAIALAARACMLKDGIDEPDTGPVSVDLTFYLVRAKSNKTRHPVVKPDLDKLARAVLDALTNVVYRDDSQVCSGLWIKKWATEGCDFHPAGVLIEIIVREEYPCNCSARRW